MSRRLFSLPLLRRVACLCLGAAPAIVVFPAIASAAPSRTPEFCSPRLLPTDTTAGAAPALVATPPSRERVFRVAAAADNLPYSNDRLEGFENRIVSLLADELGARVEYVWATGRDPGADPLLPEQEADIVPGIARGKARTLTTTSYYHSGYVFVQRTDAGFGPFRSLDDTALRELRLGLHTVRAYAGQEAADDAILREGFLAEAKNVSRYEQVDSRDLAPVLGALLRGEIDVAVMPGPLAGFLAQRESTPLTLSPVASPSSPAAHPLEARMAMAVRPGDTELRDELNAALSRRRGDIEAILQSYGVPRGPEPDTRHAHADYDAASRSLTPLR